MGCEDCEANNDKNENLDWQCKNGCLWRENSWKFDEVNYYMTLAMWANAGIDLNRLDNLTPDDFLKIAFIRKLI